MQGKNKQRINLFEAFPDGRFQKCGHRASTRDLLAYFNGRYRNWETDFRYQVPQLLWRLVRSGMAAKAGDEIPLQSMDGSVESLDYAMCLGADGMLLNNIEMALAWRTQQATHAEEYSPEH